MMTEKQMNQLVSAISEAVTKSVTTAVSTALKNALVTPTSANEGRKSATPNEPKKNEKTKYSMKLADYEPKKNGGFYNWYSYDANRTKYSYAVATNGKHLDCYENGKKVVEFADIEKKYKEAKAKFEAKYKYIKKADRNLAALGSDVD